MTTMVKLSSPWQIFYHKVSALFEQDPEVSVILDEEEYTLKLYVDNPVKAEAIGKLLPLTKEFGNVTLKIHVIPKNDQGVADLFKAAFNGNPAVSYVEHIDTPMTGELNFVVFQNKVVQYYCDNMFDINGFCSTLFQDIAKDVFNAENVSYCTDVVDAEI